MDSGNCVISKEAKIGRNVSLGNFVIIERGCEIGDNVEIGSSVIIHEGTHIGMNAVIQDGAIIGKQPKSGPRSTYRLERQRGAVIGDSCLIGTGAIVYAGTRIGNKCFIADRAGIREGCEIGEWSTIGRNVTFEFGIKVGHHTRIFANSHITEGTQIGNHVFIGPDVCTVCDKKMARDENIRTPPVIKDRSRIGCNSTILPRVTIGEDALVAGGSVVFSDVADYQIVRGNPAEFVGYVLKRDRFKENGSD
jgi:serine O-acetyltransferase